MTDDLSFPREEMGELYKAKSGGYRIADAGQATLVAGTKTVSSIYALSTNIIHLTVQAIGGTAGLLSVGTIVASTSFVINSANGADTSIIGWVILAPIK